MDAPEQFYAHSGKAANKNDRQTLRDHLLGTGGLARENASAFRAGELAWLAGVLHDLGKYTREFQLRLSWEFPSMDHATWGARIACERYRSMGKLLAYGIAGHHAGLANGKDGFNRSALADSIRRIGTALHAAKQVTRTCAGLAGRVASASIQ